MRCRTQALLAQAQLAQVLLAQVLHVEQAKQSIANPAKDNLAPRNKNTVAGVTCGRCTEIVSDVDADARCSRGEFVSLSFYRGGACIRGHILYMYIEFGRVLSVCHKIDEWLTR